MNFHSHDTKIMLNSIKARPKQSRLEKQMQQQILLIFILQVSFITNKNNRKLLFTNFLLVLYK